VSDAVASRIRLAIQERGPITFAEFMEHALYEPGGFYEEPPVGLEGHFVTSPHVHPIFAELLLRALVELWELLGRPDPLTIVEVGAGDGTLAFDLLRLARETDAPKLGYVAVERSPGARARLHELPVHVEEGLEALVPLDQAVVFANELLDNLPFRRVRRTDAGLAEIRVRTRPGGFEEVEEPCEEELASLVPPLRRGEESNVPVGAIRLIDELATTLRRGYVLLVDYGSVRGPAGEVHGYREHRVRHDVLRDPGSADITAGVDFGVVERRAEGDGLTPLGIVSQEAALRALGFDEWSRGQRERQGRLAGQRSGVLSTKVWEGRSRASLLVDPTGLGMLRWLLLGTARLSAPAWLPRAAGRPDRTAD
jgi:SAM-dependent MidA family methyltransferase